LNWSLSNKNEGVQEKSRKFLLENYDSF
jgi:hypothetical protein